MRVIYGVLRLDYLKSSQKMIEKLENKANENHI